MSHGLVARLRVLTLLVAFGFGILGQAVAVAAMPMGMSMPPSAAPSVTAVADGCGGCLGQQHAPASPAMAPSCVSAFCSVMPAVLPAGPVVATVAHTTFAPVAFRGDAGLALRPDLGPPRPIHHS